MGRSRQTGLLPAGVFGALVLLAVFGVLSLLLFMQTAQNKQHSGDLQEAIVEVESIASVYQAVDGDMEQLKTTLPFLEDPAGGLTLLFDENWNPIDTGNAVCSIRVDAMQGTLPQIQITAHRKGGKAPIFQLSAQCYVPQLGG